MALVRIQHSLQDINGLSKDRYVNTFYADWIIAGPDGAQMTAAATAVKNFYTDGDPLSVRDYLAPHVHGPGATVKMYEMTLAPTHPPIYQETYAFPGLPSPPSAYPSEVAVCLSMLSTDAPGVDIRNRRGRVYIGPLNIFAGESDSIEVPVRPSDAMRAMLLERAQVLRDELTAAGASWSIYSPKRHLALETTFAFTVTDVSVDDAFDTQRRRGCAPTVRTSAVLT